MNKQELDGFISRIKAEGLRRHHSAITKGYQRVNTYYLREYSGKFGVGYIIEYPTKESNARGNDWHAIEYWVK